MLSSVFVRALLLSLSFLPAAAPLSGVVVDPAGRPIPRALVQIVAPGGDIAATLLTESDGTFRLASPPATCRVQVSLSGFEPAAADCRTDAPLRLTLAVAPIAEQIIVSGTRTETPAGQSGASVTTFDGADIARQQTPPLADLLRQSAGVIVVATGAPGGVTSLFVRGGESSYTKVLLDGIPLNEPGGTFNLNNVTTENLDRVEVVRGANSALFGSDAMTGVVQLFTRRGTTARPDVQFGVEGGTFSTARASGSIAGTQGRTDYSANVTGFSTDNDVPNSGFDNLTLSGAAGTTLGHGASLRSIVRVERGTAGAPGQTAFGRPDLDASFGRHDAAWGVTFDQTAGALHQRGTYGIAASRQSSTNLIADPPYTPSYGGSTAPYEFSDFTYDSRNALTRHRLSYQADGTITTAHAGTHVETALVDWDGERATLTDRMASTTDRFSRNNVGLSLQHQALWARLFVTGSIRFEHNASFGNATAPRVSAAWYARSGSGTFGATRVHATAGSGIKEPTMLQSFSTNPYFLGNPGLAPERTRAVDAGVEQRFAHDRLRVDLTWFDNRYRDIIALDTDPQTFFSQYFNIGLTRARGAELTADVALAAGFRASTGYTFTDSEILESHSDTPAFQTGDPAFRRPRHSGFVNLAWNAARGSVSLTGTFAGDRSDNDLDGLIPAIVVNPGYADWSLRGSLRLSRVLSLTAAVDNLTDSRRMEPLGYPILPRAARAGLRVRF